MPRRQRRRRSRRAWRSESALERYAFPRFGSKAVTAVTRDDIRGLVTDLLAQGRSRSLVRNVIAPVRQTFNQLIEDGAIATNPAAKIGRGIFLDHATGLVVGETAVIDDDVSMLHDVTLGGTGKEAGDRLFKSAVLDFLTNRP